MPIILRHFALVLVVVTVINMVIAVRRIPKFVADRGGDGVEVTRLVWKVGAAIAGMFLLLEILTNIMGASSPLCFVPLTRPTDAMGFVAWGMWYGWTLGVTLWVLVGSGAEKLARNGPLFAKAYTPGAQYAARNVRLLALLWCAGTLAAPLAMSATQQAHFVCRPQIGRQSVTT